jgi:hypothetical protein
MGRGGAWGVSFTQVNKLGINPATSFNSDALNAGTPAGVYFYPASYFVRTVEANEPFPLGFCVISLACFRCLLPQWI